MKKIFAILLTMLLLLTMLPVSAVSVSAQVDEIIVNVKDFGAVGDGVTNDRAAIMNAFNYAISNYTSKSIPVTVYFPEGKYGLKQGGMYIDMPSRSGNLTVKGAGADKSTIVYLEEWTNSGSWVALRLKAAEEPSSPEDYLHDITIQDLGVYDTNPVMHAWHVDKGDPSTEETHGFNIQYCVRATIKNCKVDSVGDEAIDMTHCIDSQMINNVVYNSPGAGSAGGAISVGDESKNVQISNNIVIGSIDNPNKSNWAIAVEALYAHIEDVTIENNMIQEMGGWGIHIGAPGGTISNVVAKNNVITDCRNGGIRTSSTGQTINVQLINNRIANTQTGISIEGTNKDRTMIENCVVDNVSSCGISVAAPSSNDTLIRNSLITNAYTRAIYNAGTDTKIDHVLIDGVGHAGDVTTGAIAQYVPSGTTTSCSEVTNTVILNCQNRKGLQDVQKVVNTLIDQVETSGHIGISGAYLVRNCKVNRIIQAKNGATIEGLIFDTEAELGTYALYMNHLSATTVTNSVFVVPSRYAVCENGTADNNIITNNVTIGGGGIKIVGANTVATGNAIGTVGDTDQYRYRIVGGKVTIMEWLDKTATCVVVPSTVDGYPVTAIEAWAFALCADLTTITIPDSITVIGANAFYMCDALTNVNYSGSKADWDAIAIGENNDALVAARNNSVALYSDTVRHSVMDTDNGNGLAFRFELHASGVKTVSGNRVNLANATVNYFGTDCKLIGMGAVVTNNVVVDEGALTLDAVNGTNVIDVPTVYLQEWDKDHCAFATRVINIPSTALNRTVYARPYCIIEVDGEQITVYGNVDSAACADFM